MTEYGFTAGPWCVGVTAYQSSFRVVMNVTTDDNERFVAAVSSDPQHRDTIFANARLIAASSTLLEACQALLAEVDDTARRNGWAGHGARDAARAAITLATGKA